MKHLSILAVALNLSHCLSAQVVTPCENGFAGEYACDGYDLLTYFPLSAVGGGDNGNDCWGWVDEVSSREYVIFGRSNGTSFIEITDPLNPQFIATMPTAPIHRGKRSVTASASKPSAIPNGTRKSLMRWSPVS